MSALSCARAAASSVSKLPTSTTVVRVMTTARHSAPARVTPLKLLPRRDDLRRREAIDPETGGLRAFSTPASCQIRQQEMQQRTL